MVTVPAADIFTEEQWKKYVSAALTREKARSETSGLQYSDCHFKEQNIILPVQNHPENLKQGVG